MTCKTISIQLKTACLLFVLLALSFLHTSAFAGGKNDIPDARDTTVTGKVSDAQGNGIQGVSVVEQNTKKGTVSDANGRFILKVTGENSQLVFSAVGYLSRELALDSVAGKDVFLETTTGKA